MTLVKVMRESALCGWASSPTASRKSCGCALGISVDVGLLDDPDDGVHDKTCYDVSSL